MKTFDSLAEMRASLPESVCRPTVEVLGDLSDYIDEPIEQASFTRLLGAQVHLIEHVDELRKILSFDEIDGERVPLLEAASAAFDIAEWIDGGKYARFVTIESEAGGPQFIIPEYITVQVAFVSESISRLATQNR